MISLLTNFIKNIIIQFNNKMGGVKSRPVVRKPIKPSYNIMNVGEPTFIKKINKNNYGYELAKYNLTESEKKKIISGLYCKSRINERIEKTFFNKINDSLFEMSCYTFKIVKNEYSGDHEVKIVKKKVKSYVNATQTYVKKGWGILFFYKKEITENRRLTFDELEMIKKEMKAKLQSKYLC